jgi:hypothetical protein
MAMACWKEGNLDIAEMLAPMAKLKDFKSMSLRENLLETSFLIGWEILEMVASLLALYLGKPLLTRGGLEEFFYHGGEVRDFIQKNPNPSLHAIFNIHYDLSRRNGHSSLPSDS